MSESGIHKRRHKHKHKHQLREKCSRGSITEECEPQLSDHNTPEKTWDQDCAVPAAKRSKLEPPNGDTIADMCEASSSESGRHRHKKHKRKKCKESGKGLDVSEGGNGQENEDGSCRNKSNTTADKEETAVRTPAVPDLDRNSGKEQEESRKSNSEVLIPKGNRGKMAAMEYLHLWEEDRTRWSFKKKVQYWLLQNMYDKHQVSTLCRGKQKELTCTRATELEQVHSTYTHKLNFNLVFGYGRSLLLVIGHLGPKAGIQDSSEVSGRPTGKPANKGCTASTANPRNIRGRERELW